MGVAPKPEGEYCKNEIVAGLKLTVVVTSTLFDGLTCGIPATSKLAVALLEMTVPGGTAYPVEVNIIKINDTQKALSMRCIPR